MDGIKDGEIEERVVSGEKAKRKRDKRLEVSAHPLSHFISIANGSSTVFFSSFSESESCLY